MKQLPNGQIQIEPGDTLYGIYGSNWKQASGYTGDPNKLPVGTILPAPTAGNQQSPNPSVNQSAGNQVYSNTPIITPEQQQEQDELNKLKQQLEETTGKIEKAKVWLSNYPGATSTSQIPDWVLNASSPEEVKNLITPQRISELETNAFQPPQKSFQDIWTELYNNSKLPELEKKIADVKSQLYSAEGKINENPWYSEAGRVGQIKKLYDIAQKDLDNLTTQYNAELDRVKMFADAKYKEEQNIRDAQQKELEYLTKQQTAKTQVAGSSETGYYQYDSKTGTWKQVINPAPKSPLTNTPSSYDEWVLAGGQKGTGKTYSEWLAKKNAKIIPSNIITNLSTFDNTIDSWNYVKQLAEEIKNELGPTKVLNYTGSLQNFARQYKDPKLSVLLAEVDKAFQLYRKETTGAQASDKELERLRPDLPSITESPKVFFGKIDATIEGTKRARQALLNTLDKAGYDVSGYSLDSDDPINILPKSK